MLLQYLRGKGKKLKEQRSEKRFISPIYKEPSNLNNENNKHSIRKWAKHMKSIILSKRANFKRPLMNDSIYITFSK